MTSKEKKNLRSLNKKVNARMEDGGTTHCACGAVMTFAKAVSGPSVVTFHPYPVCPKFEAASKGEHEDCCHL